MYNILWNECKNLTLHTGSHGLVLRGGKIPECAFFYIPDSSILTVWSSIKGFNFMFLSLPRIFFSLTLQQDLSWGLECTWLTLKSEFETLLYILLLLWCLVLTQASALHCLGKRIFWRCGGRWRGFVPCWSIEQAWSKAGCFLLYFWKCSVKLLILTQCKLFEVIGDKVKYQKNENLFQGTYSWDRQVLLSLPEHQHNKNM